MKRTGKIVVAMVAALLLVFTAACTPRQVELVEGILQNVDSANGEITIVTKDGKTVTLTIATEAPVETEGASSAIETLEPGVFVEVEVNDDGQVAHHIKARLAKVKGTIIDIVGDNVTVASKGGQTVAVLVTNDTRIELEDDFTGTIADLHIGLEVEIKFDPESRVAFKIDTEEEEAEIEGIIFHIGSDNVTIKTEQGYKRTLVITNTTRIELEDDFTGTIVDLQVGMEVEAKFDPFTRLAFKIEVEEAEDEDEDEETSRLAPIPGAGWGIIEIRVTDPPPADVKSAVVHLTNIEVHRVSGDTSGWIPVIGAPPSFDLMVVDEVTAVLGSANVTAGRFTQIRMDVTEVTGNTTDDVPYTAEVPGRKLKIVRPFNVGGGATTVLTLDFDGEKSLIRTGSNKFLFKPVVKLSIDYKGEAEELEFEGTIKAIVGDNWTMTIDGVDWEVDVSEADIEGDPEVGLEAEVEGTVVDGIIVASEVEIKEAEELEFEGTIKAIAGDNWTMTIDGVDWEVDVSEADIEGDPEVGLEAEVEGTVVDGIIVASEVEIKEAEDTTPPEITITGVTEGQVIVSPETVTPVFSASDDTDPSPTVTATLLNGDEFTSGTEVSEVGTYELIVTAVDASGNEAEVTVNFEIVE